MCYNFCHVLRLNLQNLTMAIGVLAIMAIAAYRFQFMHQPGLYSSKNIYEQQIEMSRFLGTYYKGEKVVANDIGAISFYSEVQLLDMVGLGSTDVAKVCVENANLPTKIFNEKYRSFLIDYCAKNNYKIAIIYPSWFPVKVPSTWTPVASWKINNNKSAAINRVVFYALKPEEIKPLQQNLMNFNLNKNVEQWYYNIRTQ